MKSVIDGIFTNQFSSDPTTRARQTTHFATAILDIEEADALQTIDADNIESMPYQTWRATNQAAYLIPVFNELLDTGLRPDAVEVLRDNTRGIRDYLPLIASGQNLYEAAEQYDQDPTDENLERLGIASAVFAGEVALSEFGVPYRLSFELTGALSRHLLYRFRGQIGVKAYALMLSEVHWLIREEIVDTATYVIEKTAEYSADVAGEQLKEDSELRNATNKTLSEAEKTAINGMAEVDGHIDVDQAVDDGATAIEDGVDAATDAGEDLVDKAGDVLSGWWGNDDDEDDDDEDS
ncbi:hypothetical protein [Halomarina rubra]|uniref:Uncharacterized protein n=1 Tax=Halomarina rubra TaxID=2071873 RepID=A0ABD6AZV6_9EURY|nr:hypothetical protein [Halomarina rubra]